jgi:hypothetical protein
MPVVSFSLGRQLALLLLAVVAVWPTVIASTTPSPITEHANPALAYVGAIFTAFVTFTLIHLWSRPLAGLWVAGTALWFTAWAGPGAVCALLLAGLVTGVVVQVAVQISLREDHLLVLCVLTPLGAFLGLYALAGLVGDFSAFARLPLHADLLVNGSIQFMRETLYPFGPLTLEEHRRIAAFENQAETWIWLLPMMGSVLFGISVFIAARAIRLRLPVVRERVLPFWAFRLSEFYVYPVIALCLIDAAAFLWELTTLRLVADNALWILFRLYWIAGLAVCEGVMRQLQFRWVMRAWCWIVLVALLDIPVAILGLLDTWFPFRKLTARLLARGESR